MPRPRARFDLPTWLALGSALAAGAEELAWSRLLGRVVGHGTIALGLALAVFMAGLGAGALLAARVRAAVPSARWAFQAAEIATALGALLVLALVTLAPLPSTLLGLHGGSFALALDVTIAGLTTLAPALAMGTALPLLSEASSGAGAPSLARLYAAGLVGAVVGTLGGATLVAPSLGLDGLAVGAAFLHVLVALAARGLPADGGPVDLPRPVLDPPTIAKPVLGATRTKKTKGRAAHSLGARSPAAGAPASPSPRADAALRFAVASAIGLGLQPIWSRCIVPYAGVASLTFASIVAAYVASQAVGFWAWPSLAARRVGPLRVDDVALLSAAPAALGTLALLGPLSAIAPSRSAGAVLFATLTPLAVLVVVGPAAFLLGVAQAGALERVEGTDAARGERLGWVSGVGTLAGALVALLSGLFSMSFLGPHLGIAALGGLAAALVGVEHLGAAALALAALAALVFARPGPDHFLGSAYDTEELVYVEHGAQDTTAVVGHDSPIEGPLLRLVSSGVSYSGDSLFAQRYMRLLAHLPALAAEGRARALVICVGTGTTLDALRLHDFAAIDAVDLSPSIARTLEHFRRVHHDVTDDARVRWVTDDGARHLRTTMYTYDVITLEPPPPRAPGASSLYSRELYEAARARLAPDGALAQWLPLHGLGEREARSIVRTLAAVFPHVSLHLVERNEAVLVARTSGSAPGERRAPEAVTADLAAIGLSGVEPETDTLLLNGSALARLVAVAPIIRDAWPYPELVPLADPGRGLDVFLEELAQARDGAAAGDTGAAVLAQLAPAFVRLTEGRARVGDDDLVTDGMRRIFEARPGDPYWSRLRP